MSPYSSLVPDSKASSSTLFRYTEASVLRSMMAATQASDAPGSGDATSRIAFSRRASYRTRTINRHRCITGGTRHNQKLSTEKYTSRFGPTGQAAFVDLLIRRETHRCFFREEC